MNLLGTQPKIHSRCFQSKKCRKGTALKIRGKLPSKDFMQTIRPIRQMKSKRMCLKSWLKMCTKQTTTSINKRLLSFDESKARLFLMISQKKKTNKTMPTKKTKNSHRKTRSVKINMKSPRDSHIKFQKFKARCKNLSKEPCRSNPPLVAKI